MRTLRILATRRILQQRRIGGLIYRHGRRFYSSPSNEIYDVVVVGGGPAGLSLTNALRSSSVTSGLRVALVEGMDLGATRNWKPTDDTFSNRVSSLTPGSVSFLTDIGAWQHVKRERVQGYNGMKVWDGVSGSNIDFNWDSNNLGPTAGTIAYMTENVNLTHGLISRIDELGGTEIIDKTKVLGVNLGKDDGALDLSTWPVVEVAGGRKLTARLLVGADGANSPVRQFADIESRGWDYGRHGVVATLKTEPSDGTDGKKIAYQKFLPTGPVALLPLPGDFASLVWSTTPQFAARLKSFSQEDFVALVNAAFRLSHIDMKFYETLNEGIADDISWRETVTPVDPSRVPPRVIGVQDGTVASFPLKLRHADSYVAERTALVGDAAHSIHPLAGQGLNQGIGDVQALMRALEFAVQHGQDIGAVLSLEPYYSERYLQNHIMLGVCDKLHKLYGTDFPPVVGVRSLGLSAVNSFQGLKEFFMKQASGI